jgi:hypothetical protein
MTTEADLSTMIAHVEVQIPYQIRPIWELITDVPRMATFSPEVVSAEWLTPGGCVEGAHVRVCWAQLVSNQRPPLVRTVHVVRTVP